MSASRIDRLLAMREADPGDPFTTYALALEYASAGDPDKAVGLLEALTSDAPGYVPAYHQLGILAERRDDSAAARAWYRRGIEAARTAGDPHAAHEMQEALDLLD